MPVQASGCEEYVLLGHADIVVHKLSAVYVAVITSLVLLLATSVQIKNLWRKKTIS